MRVHVQGVVSMVVGRGDPAPAALTGAVSGPPVFTLDAPCLPGMEGGLVLAAEHGCRAWGGGGAGHVGPGGRRVLGVLGLPLSRSQDGVQMQVRVARRVVGHCVNCSASNPAGCQGYYAL